MNKKRLLSGSMYFTIAQMIIKVLSVLYLIPFDKLVKSYGIALFNFGYVPFAIFLSLTSAGIPAGISRIVSKYHAVGDLSSAYKIYRFGRRALTLLGLIGFVILFLISDSLSQIYVGADKSISTSVVSTVIRVAAIAIIFVPSLSIQTGFLQAHHDIKSITHSQILEHAFRLIFIILFSYLMTNTFIDKFDSYQSATNFAIYGAMFAATLAALIALYITNKNIKRYKKGEYAKYLKDTITKAERWQIAKEMAKICLPTIIISLDITLYQEIDQLTFVGAMASIGAKSGAIDTLAIVSFKTLKIAMIITTITSSFNFPIAPAISEAHTLKSYKNLRYTTVLVKSWVMFLATPVVIFVMLWSQDVYNIFYTNSLQGSYILAATMVYVYIWCLYSLLDNIMIGINKPMASVVAIIIGFVVKVLVQIPLIFVIHEYGMLLATILGFAATYFVLIFQTKRHLNMSFGTINSIQLQIIGLTLLVLMPLKLISTFIPYTISSKIMSFIWCGVWFSSFMIIYIWIQNKYKLIKFLFDYDGSMLGFVKSKLLRR